MDDELQYVISVRLREREHQALTERAKAEDRSMGAVVRRALWEYLTKGAAMQPAPQMTQEEIARRQRNEQHEHIRRVAAIIGLSAPSALSLTGKHLEHVAAQRQRAITAGVPEDVVDRVIGATKGEAEAVGHDAAWVDETVSERLVALVVDPFSEDRAVRVCRRCGEAKELGSFAYTDKDPERIRDWCSDCKQEGTPDA